MPPCLRATGFTVDAGMRSFPVDGRRHRPVRRCPTMGSRAASNGIPPPLRGPNRGARFVPRLREPDGPKSGGPHGPGSNPSPGDPFVGDHDGTAGGSASPRRSCSRSRCSSAWESRRSAWSSSRRFASSRPTCPIRPGSNSSTSLSRLWSMTGRGRSSSGRLSASSDASSRSTRSRSSSSTRPRRPRTGRSGTTVASTRGRSSRRRSRTSPAPRPWSAERRRSRSSSSARASSRPRIPHRTRTPTSARSGRSSSPRA